MIDKFRHEKVEMDPHFNNDVLMIKCDLAYFTPKSSSLGIKNAQEKETIVIIIHFVMTKPNSHVGSM